MGLNLQVMIKIKDVEHSYASGQKISFSDLEIENGDQWLIIGGSGKGKTTLLHILGGILKPTFGNIEINETAINLLEGSALDKFRGKHIGIIFQQPHLIKNFSVLNNVLAAQYFAGLVQNKNEVLQVLDQLGLADKANAKPDELSQGQMQRVAIARAVINKPTIIIADEPTSALDDENTEVVLGLLQSLAKTNNATLLIATHDDRIKNKIAKHYILN